MTVGHFIIIGIFSLFCISPLYGTILRRVVNKTNNPSETEYWNSFLVGLVAIAIIIGSILIYHSFGLLYIRLGN